MKTNHRGNYQGSILLIAVLTAAIVTIGVAAFLTYAHSEYSYNIRSHNWRQSMHLAEAAVEIGFGELNYQYSQGGSGFQSSRGWTNTSYGYYNKSVNNLTDAAGNAIGNLQVFVSGVGNVNPQVLGVGTVANLSGPSVSRAVNVVMQNKSQFPIGLLAKGKIDLQGQGVIDSFDSTDPAKSTFGLYDPAKKQTNGDVATTNGVANGVNNGMDVYGTIATGPSGTVAMSGGSVGATTVSSNRATSTAQGIAKGWISSAATFDVPDTSLPSALSSAPTIGAISTTTILTTGDYKIPSIALTSGKVLTLSGTVRLYVTGSLASSGSIVIAPGSKVEVYAAGSVTISGSGVVNSTGIASNNKFYGLPTSTSWDLTSNNGTWIGTIYAPQASLSYTLNGQNGYFHGAIVTKSFTLNGNVNIHYDEALRKSTGSGYSVAAWQELRNVSGSWIP